MKKQFRNAVYRKNFTLIEVVIVIVILVTLASIATPMYLNYIKSANVGAAKTQVKLLVDAVNGYKLENHEYPESLEVLTEKHDDKGPYLQGTLPKDPWGHDYVYNTPGEDGRDFDISSYGADGEPGGEGENADINSWE